MEYKTLPKKEETAQNQEETTAFLTDFITRTLNEVKNQSPMMLNQFVEDFELIYIGFIKGLIAAGHDIEMEYSLDVYHDVLNDWLINNTKGECSDTEEEEEEITMRILSESLTDAIKAMSKRQQKIINAVFDKQCAAEDNDVYIEISDKEIAHLTKSDSLPIYVIRNICSEIVDMNVLVVLSDGSTASIRPITAFFIEKEQNMTMVRFELHEKIKELLSWRTNQKGGCLLGVEKTRIGKLYITR